MNDNLIREGDIPGMLGTRDGMCLAYGVLWATWGSKDTAASIARHVLLSQLTKEEQAKGIEWVRRILHVPNPPEEG